MMSQIVSNRYVMAGATFALALGIGFVMQREAPDPLAGGPRDTPAVQQAGAAAGGAAGPEATPEDEAAAGAAAIPDTPSEQTAARADAPASDLAAPPDQPVPLADATELTEIDFTAAALPPRPSRTPRPRPAPPVRDAAAEVPGADAFAVSESAPAPACDIALEAEAAPAATVRLTLDAPCLPGERLTLHHSGLMFTAVTDADGALRLRAPVLSESAVFIAAFPSGEGAVAQVTVPDAGVRDRVALQWRGEADLHLHAFEGGAGYGEAGHVWAGEPRAPEEEAAFLMRLGDADAPEALVADVYTFPPEASRGDVALAVEAEVTAETCDRELSADTLGRLGGKTATPREITIFMPDCAAQGDFLVLKNLFEDMKLASD
ncbi:hypothetical protein [Rhodosalinus sp.]|uniref:hypothetical protein n=1 Tax=Rhodosalinus sp. TaxID=2047741 RepID=UPI00356628C2